MVIGQGFLPSDGKFGCSPTVSTVCPSVNLRTLQLKQWADIGLKMRFYHHVSIKYSLSTSGPVKLAATTYHHDSTNAFVERRDSGLPSFQLGWETTNWFPRICQRPRAKKQNKANQSKKSCWANRKLSRCPWQLPILSTSVLISCQLKVGNKWQNQWQQMTMPIANWLKHKPIGGYGGERWNEEKGKI